MANGLSDKEWCEFFGFPEGSEYLGCVVIHMKDDEPVFLSGIEAKETDSVEGSAMAVSWLNRPEGAMILASPNDAEFFASFLSKSIPEIDAVPAIIAHTEDQIGVRPIQRAPKLDS